MEMTNFNSLANKLRQTVVSVAIILFFVSCERNTIEVEGLFITADDTTVYIESYVSDVRGNIIDSAKVDSEGRFIMRFEPHDTQISIYNLVCDHQRIPLLLQGGDKVNISAMGNIISTYRVEGSHESELLREFYQPYVTAATQLNKLAERHQNAEGKEKIQQEIYDEYAKLYQSIRRTQVEYIVKNKSNIAAVYAISQRLPGDTYLFNAQSDAIYYRTVVEALEESYPESKYLPSLKGDMDNLESVNRLAQNITTASLPEINMPDMFGKRHKLSDLIGKVVLLEFWSSELGNSNMLNAQLKETYAKYKDKGFEVYHVSIDPMKSRWIATIQEQELEWISVNDLQGIASPSLALYNVNALPTNYLINREGDIVARNVLGDGLEQLIKSELAKP